MPLTFDYPLEKLYTYQGMNPRPADFDAFWDAALAEMRALDAQVELVPAEFQVPFADCLHLYFTGVGGARVHTKLVQPKVTKTPHPAVLMFHGYTGDSGDFPTSCLTWLRVSLLRRWIAAGRADSPKTPAG